MINPCIIAGCKKFPIQYEVCKIHLRVADHYALMNNVSLKEGCKEIIKMRGEKPQGRGNRRRKTNFD